MSAIIGPITPGKIAFALGSIGIGALVGGAYADSKDGDVAKGALYGGLAAVAGLALITGGAYAWNRFQAGRAAATGAAQLGTTFSHSLTPAATTTSTITHAATSSSTSVATLMRLPSPASLFHTSPALTPALTTTVPAIARTPMLPVAASSGGTFVDALRSFIR
jgi:hypothetical protein